MNPAPPKKKKAGMSSFAVVMWGVVLSPFFIAGLSLFALAIMLLSALIMALPIMVVWNIGVQDTAELFGVALASIGLVKAFAVALTVSLLNGIFGSNPVTKAAQQHQARREAK